MGERSGCRGWNRGKSQTNTPGLPLIAHANFLFVFFQAPKMTQGKIDEALQLASALGHDPILLHAPSLGPWATFKSN